MSVLAANKSKSAARPTPPLEKMPGHWVLAKMGKRVLRPGGVVLTRQLMTMLAIDSTDDVVEFAPGLGYTAQLTLARSPRSYTAVERDNAAAAQVATYLSGPHQRCMLGSAEDTGLPNASATVVYGEAMLSMQPATAKARIAGEAARLLRPGGRYGIHELCISEDVTPEKAAEIARDLSDEIHVGVRPLTIDDWRRLLESAGLVIVTVRLAPMHLLEPRRIIADEGIWRALRFAWNLMGSPVARRRVWTMRKAFRKHRQQLGAIMIVAVKN